MYMYDCLVVKPQLCLPHVVQHSSDHREEEPADKPRSLSSKNTTLSYTNVFEIFFSQSFYEIREIQQFV